MTLSGPQRLGQDDAAADARRRDVGRRRRAVASRRARASRCTTSARRASATSRCATTCCPAARSCSRSRSELGRARAGDGRGRHRRRDARRLRRARRRGSSTPAATTGASGVNATLHGLGFRDERPRPRARDVLRRRADARARSPARWPATPTCCCSTSRPTTSTSSRSSGSRATCRRSTPPIVLVAHDRWFLEAVGTAVLELEAGRGALLQGHLARLAQGEGGARAGARPRDRAQQAEIARLERFVDRFRAGTRARQAQSRVKKLDKIDRIERDPRDGKALGFAFKPPERSGRVVFELEDGDAADRRARRCSRTPSCGSSAASTSRWSAPTAPARRR